MKVKALKEYSDKFIAMFEGDIRTVTDEPLAEELIEAGILEDMTEEEEEQPTDPVEPVTEDPNNSPK